MKNLPPNIQYMFLSDKIINKIDIFPKNIKYLKLGFNDKTTLNKLYDLPKLGILSFNKNFINIKNQLKNFTSVVPKIFIAIQYFKIKESKYVIYSNEDDKDNKDNNKNV